MGYIEDKIDHLAAEFAQAAELDRARREASLAESLRGLRIDGALPRPFRPNALNYSAGGRLVGWSLRAVTADVTITFRDGADSSADAVATVVVQVAGPGSTVPLPGAGVSFVDGLYAEVTTAGGSVVGAVWIGAAD